MASTLPSPFISGLQRPKFKSKLLPQFHVSQNPNPNFRISAAASSSSDWEREEVRWIREEQRWLREEQRWVREEARWIAEREYLLKEIDIMRLKIQSLERGKALDVVGKEVGERFKIAEKAEVKEVIFEEKAEVREVIFEEKEEVEKLMLEEIVKVGDEKKERRALRMGAEGEDVKELQEALLKLGFYSGEEDMEFSSFSSGTQRAVKTWQSSVGILDDGIMTLELLERLLEEGFKEDSIPEAVKDIVNGAPPAAVSKVTEIKETVIKESSGDKYEESSHRVFLLGENRWEEPSRLKERDKIIGGSKNTSTAKCLTCRGEGRLMCLECDGSGEPNIEPQFMEWVDEGAKCAYCEGLGHTVCDVCKGKGAATLI